MAGIARDDSARYQPRLHDLRQHADFLIMPTTYCKQQLGGDRAVARIGIIKGFPRRLTACRQSGNVLV